MAAPLLNQTLHLTATNITSSPTPLPALGNQQSHWDAVAVYGFVFGLLAVLLAVPGAYLAIVALRKHREFEAQLYATNDLESSVDRQALAVAVIGGLRESMGDDGGEVK